MAVDNIDAFPSNAIAPALPEAFWKIPWGSAPRISATTALVNGVIFATTGAVSACTSECNTTGRPVASAPNASINSGIFGEDVLSVSLNEPSATFVTPYEMVCPVAFNNVTGAPLPSTTLTVALPNGAPIAATPVTTTLLAGVGVGVDVDDDDEDPPPPHPANAIKHASGTAVVNGRGLLDCINFTF